MKQMMDMKIGRPRHNRLAAAVSLALLSLVLPGYSSAQILDDVDVDVITAGKGAELRIRFNIPVQYLRHAPLGKVAADSVEIFYRILPGGELPISVVDETKKVAPPVGVPRFTVLVPGQSGNEARVILRFEKPVAFKVRQGRDSRSIVLELPNVVVPEAKAPQTTVITPIVAAVAVIPVTPITPSAATKTTTTLPAPSIAPVTATSPSVQVADPIQPSPLVPATQAAGGFDQIAIDNQGKGLIGKAQDALNQSQFDAAIEALNQLLNLPPNASTRDGQELIGTARERAGQPAKAKAEYELYVKLYPTGEGADRVKARLIALNGGGKPATVQPGDVKTATTEPVPVAGVKPKRRDRAEAPPETRVYGSYSSYFYFGNSHTDTSTLQAGTDTRTVETLTLDDQTSWVNSWDFNIRHRSKDWDNRFVFRTTDTYYLSCESPLADLTRPFSQLIGSSKSGWCGTPEKSKNRLSSAYGEMKNRPDDWLVRVGRQNIGQNSITGILSRFDGVLGGWGFDPKIRVNAAVGVPSLSEPIKPIVASIHGDKVPKTTFSQASQPFFAASVDLGPYRDNQWSGSLYAINQMADSMTGRRAVGAEVRYFQPKVNVYSLLDYDVRFRALNILMVNGNYYGDKGVSYNFTLDRRRTPTLSATNALIPESGNVTTIKQLLAASSEAQIIANAKDSTPISTSMSVGATWQINQKWQIGSDLRYSTLSATKDVPIYTTTDPLNTVYAAQQSSGNDWSLSFNAITNGTLLENDLSVLNMVLLDSRTYQGVSLSGSYRAVLAHKWTLDGLLTHYREWRVDGRTNRTTPGFRVSYKFQDNLTFESEMGAEFSSAKKSTKIDPAATEEESTRMYMTLGLRWDY